MNTALSTANAYDLNEERQAFSNLAKEIATKKLAEHREENDKYPFGELFNDAIKDAGVVGFYGINLPADNGGVGMNAGMVAVILEKLSETDASLAGIVFTNAAALEILKAASESADVSNIYQSIKNLGTAPIAFHSYEGPDEIDMPVANKTGTSIIFGKINYLPLGDISNYAVLPAKKQGEKGFSYYLIDLSDARVQKSKPIVSLGLHACPAVNIIMEKVPAQLIGEPGEGEKYFLSMRDQMSVCAAAMALGNMRGSFNDALQYTADRYQGGRQIIDWGQVRMMLANMAIETKIAESCLAMACQEMDCSVSGWEKTAQAAAIHIGEMANRSCTDGVQLFGGNGYMKDYPQEKRMRDTKQIQCLLGRSLLRKMDYIAGIIEENK
jgi:alkylation response protein AidB-like acyl-CoA dehydrogenase